MYVHASSQNAAMSLQLLIIKKSRQQILNHSGGWKVNEVLHFKSCQFRPSTRNYWSTQQNTTACVLNKPSPFSFSISLLYKPWMCVDLSCKTAYISSQWLQITSFFKCCCFLFDGTDFWESSVLDYFCCAMYPEGTIGLSWLRPRPNVELFMRRTPNWLSEVHSFQTSNRSCAEPNA